MQKDHQSDPYVLRMTDGGSTYVLTIDPKPEDTRQAMSAFAELVARLGQCPSCGRRGQ
jgi:hypothetical protein